MKAISKREQQIIELTQRALTGIFKCDIESIKSRLDILECDHQYVPTEYVKSYSYQESGGMVMTSRKTYSVKCAKCGHVLCDMTERDYLVEKIENHSEQCKEDIEQMKIRLAQLEPLEANNGET